MNQALRKNFYIYVLSSTRDGVLYVGVTADLIRRIWEHRAGLIPGFTRKYGVKRLVYFERHDDHGAAILREKRIKKWNRAWKVRFIEEVNPGWEDLYERVIAGLDDLRGFPPARE